MDVSHNNYFNGMKFVEFNQIGLGDGSVSNRISLGKVVFDIENITTLYQVADNNNKLIKDITVIRDRHGCNFAVSHSIEEVKASLEETKFS